MIRIEILEVPIGENGKRKSEYIVRQDGLVQSTQLRVLARALQNLTYYECFDGDPKVDELKDALNKFFDGTKNG